MSERAGVVFPFEDIDEALSLLPLAARRALDHAGFRLSLEGYQSMPVDARSVLAALGAQEVVDAREVEAVVRKSSIPATKIKPVPDPDALAPPEQLITALGNRASSLNQTWSKLRGLERFALVHVMRRSIAHDDPARLDAAVHHILGVGKGSPGPSTKRSERPPPASSAEEVAASRRSAPSPDALLADSPGKPGEFPPAPPLPDLKVEPGAASRGRYSSIPPPPPQREEARRASAPPAPPAPPAAWAAPGSWAPPPQVSTHVGAGGEVHMVDVGAKAETARRATATGAVFMRPETASRLARADVPKGEVLATARVAGIMAAKRTPEIIPLCHHVALTRVEVLIDIEVASGTVTVTSVAEATDRTGVEMEALVATSVACLTIYDMLKGVDRDMVVGDIKLLGKSGGKHGSYVRKEP